MQPRIAYKVVRVRGDQPHRGRSATYSGNVVPYYMHERICRPKYCDPLACFGELEAAEEFIDRLGHGDGPTHLEIWRYLVGPSRDQQLWCADGRTDPPPGTVTADIVVPLSRALHCTPQDPVECWKLLHVTPDGLRSFLMDSRYEPLQWTHRPPGGGPLACFDSLGNALHFRFSNRGCQHYVLHRSYGFPSADPQLYRPGCPPNPSPLPPGTILMDSVMLAERFWSSHDGSAP